LAPAKIDRKKYVKPLLQKDEKEKLGKSPGGEGRQTHNVK